MRRSASTVLAAPLLLSVSLLFSSCGSQSHGLTLYNGQHEQTTALLVKSFERLTLGNQIDQEGANSPADIFYTENTPVLEALAHQGMFAAVAPATLAAVPSRDDSAAGLWVGVSARVSALVYNTTKLRAAELPDSILELAAPKWHGKVGFAPSETDFQPLVTAVIRLDGRAALYAPAPQSALADVWRELDALGLALRCTTTPPATPAT